MNANNLYPKYQITRTFGISSTATGYEYRRVARGEFGETTYKTFPITAKSMHRVYNLIKALHNAPFTTGSQVKGVTRLTRYNRILKVRDNA